MKANIALIGMGIGLAAAGIVLASVAVVQARGGASGGLPVLYDVPPFALTDSDGQPLGLDQLRGKVWVVDFIFTTCAGPCPVLTGQMSTLHRQFRDDDRVRMVSITVDPENDTPPVLKAYASTVGAGTARWHFLTGPGDAIQTLAREGLKLGSGNTPLLHDTHFVLVDDRGRVRAYYDGTDFADVERLATDLRALLGEL